MKKFTFYLCILFLFVNLQTQVNAGKTREDKSQFTRLLAWLSWHSPNTKDSGKDMLMPFNKSQSETTTTAEEVTYRIDMNSIENAAPNKTNRNLHGYRKEGYKRFRQ